jgi:hypothetical protein
MPKFICSSCGKRYTEECWYRKHVEKCKLINVIEQKEEMTNIELTRTVQYLLEVVREQNTKIQSLKRWACREKKKCNITEWLNSCYETTPNIAFFTKNIIVTQKELNYLFKTDFVEGIVTILQNILIGHDIPIRCFDKDRNKFYIKKETWMCDNNEMNQLIDFIVTKLIELFSKWTKENTSRVLNEKTNDDYLTKLDILVISIVEKKKKYPLIQKKLYTYLKESLQSVVEYEFIF